MGMKGLRVECGDNFMSVVRKKDGTEIGRVRWAGGVFGRHRVVVSTCDCHDAYEQIIDASCGVASDDVVVGLVRYGIECLEIDHRLALERVVNKIAVVERNLADLKIGSELEDT